MNHPLPIDRIPHQPPMRWIRGAVQTGEKEALCEAVLPTDCGERGEGPILLGLEILAQAGAVLLASTSSGPALEGRLISVREARWNAEALPLETPLKVRVEWTQSSAIGLHRFSGKIENSKGAVLLKAEFGLLVGGPSA